MRITLSRLLRFIVLLVLLLSLTSCTLSWGAWRDLPLTVATYNISAGHEVDYRFESIIVDITEANADIIALQEVDLNALRSGRLDTAKYLAEGTKYPYYHFFSALEFPTGGEYGLAILSRYPILHTETVKLPSLPYEQRILAHAEIALWDKTIHFFATHLSYEKNEVRASQFAGISQILSEYEDYILAGDFNIVHFAEFEAIPEAAAVYTEKDGIITFPGNKTGIDNILFSPSFWSFDFFQVFPQTHSDHYLLSAKLHHTYLKQLGTVATFGKKEDEKV